MSSELVLTDENTSGKVLDHLGLVMSTIDRLGIIDKIDALIPLAEEKNPKTTVGQRVAAMILNGLGFVDNRLYMFPDFLANKPVERLLGKGLNADHFNGDTLGRGLDKIFDYGTTALFSELAFEIGMEQNLLGGSANFDTTSLTVHGDYEVNENLLEEINKKSLSSAQIDNPVKTNESISKEPTITYGYSKDHRPDLKQVVLNLATTGAAGFPIWMESHSGNASDQKELRAAAERMQEFCKELEKTPSFMFVADSAMYESCLKEDCKLLWLSRAPERSKWVKTLLEHDDSSYAWLPLENGYRMCVVERMDKNIHQRLCVISSEQAYKRELKTFIKNLDKQLKMHEKSLWHLSNKEFGCIDDAKTAVKELNKKMKYHQAEVIFEEILRYQSNGRPKKNETPQVVGYKIAGSIVNQEEKIEATRRRKGRFLLATNELDRSKLPDEQLLKEYKEQSKTESGFRFIKDDAFEVSSIFLKKPSRISALMMVMTLCLMVYSVAQHQFREAIKEVELDEFDPKNKLTNKPTMKRVFKLFQGVHELTVKLGEHVQCLIINLNKLTKMIVQCFGGKAVMIYELSG